MRESSRSLPYGRAFHSNFLLHAYYTGTPGLSALTVYGWGCEHLRKLLSDCGRHRGLTKTTVVFLHTSQRLPSYCWQHYWPSHTVLVLIVCIHQICVETHYYLLIHGVPLYELLDLCLSLRRGDVDFGRLSESLSSLKLVLWVLKQLVDLIFVFLLVFLLLFLVQLLLDVSLIHFLLIGNHSPLPLYSVLVFVFR